MALASFITLGIGGIITTGYLLWQHYNQQNAPLICPLNHDCSKVTESSWSRILYVRNDVAGMIFYVLVLGAAMIQLVSPTFFPQLSLIIILGTGAGLLFSLFLLYVQLKIIKDYCFYCLISALLTALLFINSFFLV